MGAEAAADIGKNGLENVFHIQPSITGGGHLAECTCWAYSTGFLPQTPVRPRVQTFGGCSKMRMSGQVKTSERPIAALSVTSRNAKEMRKEDGKLLRY